MGNPKQKWTAEEEEALRRGVIKHGAGKWKAIQKDVELNKYLHSRSNIDLKDKWRNLSIQSRERSKPQRAKANPDIPATPLPKQLPVVPFVPVAQNANGSSEVVNDDASKCLLDGKTASKYDAMIFEALNTIKDPNGLDTSALVSFIEKRHEVTQNFRKLLGARLRKLVQQDKLEKVQNCYKKKKAVLLAPKPPAAKASGVQPTRQQQQPLQPKTSGYLANTVEEAAVAAAYKIADAENKAFVAAEAVKEAERVSKMAEDTDSLLQFAKEIFDKCSRGEVVLMA